MQKTASFSRSVLFVHASIKYSISRSMSSHIWIQGLILTFFFLTAGGLLRQAQVEEFHVITWEAKKEQIFEMPTGGAAIMRQGPNLLKLARKEQCLALLTQLRTKFKTDGAIYRVFPNGEVQYLHPKDGVYPEKVNAGRTGANANMRRIGQNVNPITVKFTGKDPQDL